MITVQSWLLVSLSVVPGLQPSDVSKYLPEYLERICTIVKDFLVVSNCVEWGSRNKLL